ncbi:unnamed protein product [Schistosoma turkestanicum]|nr:unnamed protein product [Schistosoma turkestanicum]
MSNDLTQLQMSEDQQHTNSINEEYCPTTRLSYHPTPPHHHLHPVSYLTGIHEDTRGELAHSISDFQQYHIKQSQEQSMHTCAVPINVCCVCSNDNDQQSLHSEVQVLCASPGCKYSGPIHRKCLEHWDTCCDFYCHLLNNSFQHSLSQTSQTSPSSSLFDTINSTTNSPPPPATSSSSLSILSNFNDSPLHKSFIEGLFRLYECPLCGQYTLYRSTIHHHHHLPVTSNFTVTNNQTSQPLSSTTSNPFTSVLCAIQYATEKLNQSEYPIHQSDPCKSYNTSAPTMELSSPRSHSKLPTATTTGRSHSYVQPPLITDQFSDILR